MISDFNVPFLVTYHQQAHAGAGVILGACTDLALRQWLPMRSRSGHVVRLLSAIGFGIVAGTVKEYGLDLHPRLKEIGPWGVGAGTAALTCEFAWSW